MIHDPSGKRLFRGPASHHGTLVELIPKITDVGKPVPFSETIELVDFVSGILDAYPRCRTTAREALEHDFL